MNLIPACTWLTYDAGAGVGQLRKICVLVL